jgi:hypothetical protein
MRTFPPYKSGVRRGRPNGYATGVFSRPDLKLKFSAASGIIVGPILLVVARLAILATAIAAGIGAFSSGS